MPEITITMPKTIGGYSILGGIGSGAFGTVYRAYDPQSGRAVALKTLSNSDAQDRFRREAYALYNIDHPNVISVLDHGIDDEVEGVDGEVWFIVMEQMPLNLRETLSHTERLPFTRAVMIAWQVANGLEAAANQGIVHRDVRPENILLDWDSVYLSHDMAKIADLGMAYMEDFPRITVAGNHPGHQYYRPPEKEVDTRSDIYSLGLVIHEMLTGKAPPHQRNLERDRPNTPRDLVRIVDTCLEYEPDDRYQSFSELIAEIANADLFNRSVLIDLFEATDGENWFNRDCWLTDEPLSVWYGIEADRDGGVVKIALNDNNLNGRIPSEIAMLYRLKHLNLSGNLLFGKIPLELGSDKLNDLVELDISGNRITGHIPRALCDLENLNVLGLSNPDLVGCIPKPLWDIEHNDLDEVGLPDCDH